MAFTFYKIPARGCLETERELNAFLATNRILSVDRRWVELGDNSYWALCVDYLPINPAQNSKSSRKYQSRVDYKDQLNEEDFKVFSELRELRKSIANSDGVPVYAVFTNEQLANMVKKRTLTHGSMSQIDGIGKAKLDKYAERFLVQLNQSFSKKGSSDETSQPPATKNS